MDYYKLGQHEKAAEKLVQLLDFDKTNSKGWNALGVCLSKLEDHKQARICFLNAVKYAPDNETYLKNLRKAKEKIPPKPSEKPEYSRLKKIRRSLSDFSIGTTEYACLALSIILLASFFILPHLSVIIPSPAREILGLCGIIFAMFFVISTLMRYFQYLGLKRIHFIITLIALLLIAYPIFHLLNLQDIQPIPGNLSEYQNRSYTPVTEPPVPPKNPAPLITPVTEQKTEKGTLPASLPPSCPIPGASFEYQIIRLDPYQVQFYDTSDTLLGPISLVTWDFGDNTSSVEKKPLHEYEGSPKPYKVNLTVRNECGGEGSVVRNIEPVFSNLSPVMKVIPERGLAPMIVQFSDISDPLSEITAWRWTFGDGTIYETTNPSTRNTTHTYSRAGTYYAILTVKNRYNQEFTIISPVQVMNLVKISGTIWNDENGDGLRDEPEKNLTGWQVSLDKKSGSGWKPLETRSTDPLGQYLFTIQDNGGIYRIRVLIPESGEYIITNPDNFIIPNVSSPIPLYGAGESFIHDIGIIGSEPGTLHEISLSSSRSGIISAGSMIRWQENGDDGRITINGSPKPIRRGSICELTYQTPSNSSLIRIAGGVDATNLSNVSCTIDHSSEGTVYCDSAWSSSVSSLVSNLNLVLESDRDSYISLIWDGKEIPVSWRQTVNISGLMPMENQRMELDLHDNRVFVIGRALSYEILIILPIFSDN